jgi:hypothetical protein
MGETRGREDGERKRLGFGCAERDAYTGLATHGGAIAVAHVPGRGAALPRRRCSIPYGVASAVATRVRDRRGRTSNDVKSLFCPLRGSRTTGGTTATPWPSHLHGNATYPKSPTTGTRSKQAHKSVEAVGSEDSQNTLQETDGADHVNSDPSLIGRPGSHDRENERRTRGHVIRTDGQD